MSASSETVASNSEGLEDGWAEASRDLDEVTEYAQEEEYPVPSEIAQKNARRLLREMYMKFPRRYGVYPTPDAEVAVDAPDGKRQSVLVLCDSDGGVLCLVNVKSRGRYARYDSATTLPDGFLTEALAELDDSER